MADLKISQFTPVTDPTDVTLAGYKGLDNVKLSAEIFATGTDIDSLTDRISGAESYITTLAGQIDEVISDVEDIDSQIDIIGTEVNTIQEVIPNTASSTNQLVDRDTMNSTVTSLAANYVTYTANGDAFPTLNDLLTATTVYHGGVAYTPTAKDYATVLADPTAPVPFTGGTVRRTYDGAVWAYSYGINEQPLTADQVAAVNSGITAAKVADMVDRSSTQTISGLKIFSPGAAQSSSGGNPGPLGFVPRQYMETQLATKQNVLTAGENITIDTTNPQAPVISAAGGGDFIDKNTFINMCRGQIGPALHLAVNAAYYVILSDGIVRQTDNFSLNIPGSIKINNITYPISELRGMRFSGSTQHNLVGDILNGVPYEHFSVTINLRNSTPYAWGGSFLNNSNLEYLAITAIPVAGSWVMAAGSGEATFCSNLPNFNTLVLSGDVLINIPTGRAFVNVKNDPSCILYVPNTALGDTIKNRYPGLSNWSVRTLSMFT